MTIVDRTKDIIITGGRNVCSIEVENLLAAHPDIADPAIIGQPDETFGEMIVAVVTPVDGAEVTLEGVRVRCRLCRGLQAGARADPPGGPTQPVGKILKHVIRKELAAG